jgi:putative hydrolase of the HAD superfamily
MTISAVLFDVDNTLVDHRASALRGISEHLVHLYPELRFNELELVTATWLELEEIHMNSYLSGACTFQEQRRQRVQAMLEVLRRDPLSADDIDEWFAGYLRHYESSWSLFPDVVPALEQLRKLENSLVLGILTNGDASQQNAKIEQVGLRSYFRCVTSSSQLSSAKPDARAFIAACGRINVEPDRVMYVGDRLETDALAAEKAGLRGVWLSRDGHIDTRVSTIQSLIELPSVINRIAS